MNRRDDFTFTSNLYCFPLNTTTWPVSWSEFLPQSDPQLMKSVVLGTLRSSGSPIKVIRSRRIRRTGWPGSNTERGNCSVSKYRSQSVHHLPRTVSRWRHILERNCVSTSATEASLWRQEFVECSLIAVRFHSNRIAVIILKQKQVKANDDESRYPAAHRFSLIVKYLERNPWRLVSLHYLMESR
jgi:hypothetical protein